MKMRKSTHLWREEDHPRDDYGRFCKSNHLGEKIVDKDKKGDIVNGVKLTKQELAIWYEKIGEIKRGYWCPKLINGHYLIPVKNKVIFTSGTYEEPEIGKLLRFSNEYEVIIFLKLLED